MSKLCGALTFYCTKITLRLRGRNISIQESFDQSIGEFLEMWQSCSSGWPSISHILVLFEHIIPFLRLRSLEQDSQFKF